jgi:hypothetical protein
MAAISAHFGAAIPNFKVLEVDVDDVPWKDEIVPALWKESISQTGSGRRVFSRAARLTARNGWIGTEKRSEV